MRTLTLIRRVGAIVIVCAGLQPCLSGAPETKDTIPDDEIILLPKYEVTADRVLAPLEKWRYVSIPGYEVLSNASAAGTERFVKDFYLLRQVVQVLMPGLESNNGVPAYIVLCAKDNSFEQFLPEADKPGVKRSASFVTRDAERSAIVINYIWGELTPEELASLNLTDPSSSAATAAPAEPGATDDFDVPVIPGMEDQTTVYQHDPTKQFYREYFRQLLRRNLQPTPPLWMEEGLVRIFAGVEFTPTSIHFEKVGGGALNTGGFNLELAQSRLIPLKEFFEAEETSTKYSNQAYLFTQLCLYGRGGAYVKAYHQLVEKAARGPITEEVFKQCFDMTFKDMGILMRGYLQKPDPVMPEYVNGRLPPVPPLAVREATDAESGRIAGEVLRLAGHKDAARQRLMAPYLRGQTDPEMLAALGMTELEVGNDARAQKFLEIAVKYNTTRSRVYYELGKLRLKNATAKAASESRALTATELAAVAEPLKAGLKQQPTMAETYALLVQVWSHSEAIVTKEDFELLVPGAGRLAKNLKLIYQIAELGVQRRFFDTVSVRSMVEFGLQNARTPEAKQLFEKLAARLPAAKTAGKR